MAISTKEAVTLLSITSSHFQRGYELGRIAHFYVWRVDGIGQLDDEYLVSNLLAYIERGLHENTQYFAQQVSFLIGMISGSIIDKQEGE